jgi:hypothetical protein
MAFSSSSSSNDANQTERGQTDAGEKEVQV